MSYFDKLIDNEILKTEICALTNIREKLQKDCDFANVIVIEKAQKRLRGLTIVKKSNLNDTAESIQNKIINDYNGVISVADIKLIIEMYLDLTDGGDVK